MSEINEDLQKFLLEYSDQDLSRVLAVLGKDLKSGKASEMLAAEIKKVKEYKQQ